MREASLQRGRGYVVSISERGFWKLKDLPFLDIGVTL